MRVSLDPPKSSHAVSGAYQDGRRCIKPPSFLSGCWLGHNIQFSKRYISISQGKNLYQWLLSKHENLMQGEWILKMSSLAHGEMTDYGRWEATRSENDLSN
jgi:hypothetical protein